MHRTNQDLPFLPGNSFEDTSLRGAHKRSHVFDYKNGLPVVSDFEMKAPDNLSLTKTKKISSTVGQDFDEPQWLSLDRKVLRFFCFFKESVHESRLEQQRVRRCVIYYYLEDDTIHVSEPKQDNSGIPQGTLIKRHRIPKKNNEYYTIDDFNVNEEVNLYGKVFRILACDDFTKNFLNSIGNTVPDFDEYPYDQYSDTRAEIKKNRKPTLPLSSEDKDFKRYMEYSFKGRHCGYTKTQQQSIQQFLKNDRKVLRFYCCWDDRTSLYGDYRYFVLNYFQSDDTIDISEVNPPNSGRDPFPVFVKRNKLPKRHTEKDTRDFYVAQDLSIGTKINVYGREFLLYDCDEFTKQYYRLKFGITDFTPMDVEIKHPDAIKVDPPPYNGFGSEEDSLGSWLYLVLKPPKKDIKRYVEYDKKNLRFGAKLATNRPEDMERHFLITFYLADGTISIFEPAKRNSGIIGGKFLKRQRIKKPKTTGYYTAGDFYVGSCITIFNHNFIVCEVDEHTVKYMESRPKEFTMADIKETIRKLRNILEKRHTKISDSFRKIDTDKSGSISIEEFRQLFYDFNIELCEQEIITIMRYFDKNNDGQISYQEFLDKILAKDSGEYEEITKDNYYQTQKMLESQHLNGKEESFDDSIESATAKFMEKVEARRLLFQDTFRILSDKSFDSLIGPEEFKFGVKRLGVSLNDSEVNALIESFFPSGRSRVSLDDFTKIVAGTSTWNLSN